MKYTKSYDDWVSESKKVKPENEDITFWAGAEQPTTSDDPDVGNMRMMFKDRQISRMTNYGRKISYI
jgi:hypothetical protein